VESGKFLEMKRRTESPSIKIAVLRQRIEIASEDFSPILVTNTVELKNNWLNRYKKRNAVINESNL